MTRIYAIIADPIAQVRSPQEFRQRFAERGIDATMVPLHVGSHDFSAVTNTLLSVRNFDGVVVSVPHKFTAAQSCRSLVGEARATGAVNVMRRCVGGWEGGLLDGEGFVGGLRMSGYDPAGMKCAIVGSGGAGTAIASSLLKASVGQLVMSDIDDARLGAAVRRLQRTAPERVVAGSADASCDLAVNATPLGMSTRDPLPFDPGVLGPDAIVAEVIMTPARTALLDAAAALGLRTVEGRRMLDGQLDAMWEFFGLP